MKSLSYRLVLAGCATFIGIVCFFNIKQSVYARSDVYNNVNVDITLNKDSSFDVTETLTIEYDGEYHGTFREITLEDFDSLKLCKENASFTCGGFYWVQLKNIEGEGNVLNSNQYDVKIVETNGERRFRIEWEFARNGRIFNHEKLTWSITYTIYGGIGYYDDYDLFYWDTLFPDRTVDIKKSQIHLHFPTDIDFQESNLQVLGGDYDYTYQYDSTTNTLNLTTTDISPSIDVTVLLKFPKEIIDTYGTVTVSNLPKNFEIDISGPLEVVSETSLLNGLPAGSYTIDIKSRGYYTQTVSFDISAGESKSIEANLQKTPFQIAIEIILILCNVFSCLLFISLIFILILRYRNHGRDPLINKAVIPEFKPPDAILPALLGSIKDEKVDLTDITSTIINVAYKGYIHIKELGNKNYELIKKKSFDELEDIEKLIMEKIFGSNETIKTDALKYSFYKEISGINDAIYDNMVKDGYFAKRPDKVRNIYLLWGGVLIAIGIVSGFWLFSLQLYTLSPALVVIGIVLMIISSAMPAKTKQGAEVYHRIKGFKMYLETAEKYTLQKLTPELFEKYLSYAIVFGIEKQWAKNFENIYTQPPDWYESDSWTTFNTLIFVNNLSTLNQNVGTVMAASPSGSSSSGGGWSGGGGFSGGFSGGGGGGGGGGSW